MLQTVTDTDREIYFVGDLNIDWFPNTCTLKKKLSDVATVCNLSQIVSLPTRVNIRSLGMSSSTCIDHIFTNSVEICSKIVSVPVGFSDHNIIAVARTTKVPKAGPKVIYKIIYKTFCEDAFIEDMNKIQWDNVVKLTHTEAAVQLFMQLFLSTCDKHAPIRKLTVRTIKAPWFDLELRSSMTERDQLKKAAITSGSSADWQAYRSVRNSITKMNKQKKRQYNQSKIGGIKGDSKKLRRTLMK